MYRASNQGEIAKMERYIDLYVERERDNMVKFKEERGKDNKV